MLSQAGENRYIKRERANNIIKERALISAGYKEWFQLYEMKLAFFESVAYRLYAVFSYNCRISALGLHKKKILDREEKGGKVKSKRIWHEKEIRFR